MKKFLLTIYNDVDGGISYEYHTKVCNESDIKGAIIALLQNPDVKINVNDNILVQEEKEE